MSAAKQSAPQRQTFAFTQMPPSEQSAFTQHSRLLAAALQTPSVQCPCPLQSASDRQQLLPFGTQMPALSAPAQSIPQPHTTAPEHASPSPHSSSAQHWPAVIHLHVWLTHTGTAQSGVVQPSPPGAAQSMFSTQHCGSRAGCDFTTHWSPTQVPV